MRPSLLLCALLAAPGLAHTQAAKTAALPDWTYFNQNWCPDASQLASLSAHFELTMSSCCIYKAVPRDRTNRAAVLALQPVAKHISPTPDVQQCQPLTPEQEAAERAEAAAAQAEVAAKAEAERKAAPGLLRALSTPTLCSDFGRALRNGSPFTDLFNLGTGVIPLARAEIARRGLTVREASVKTEQVRLGDTACHLYAARGKPDDVNRTVNAYGEHLQLIYGGNLYIYVVNGRITSWQD